MRFFVPGTDDASKAEELWRGAKTNAEETMSRKISDRRIFSIAYIHNRKNDLAQVGKPDLIPERLLW